MSARKFVRVSSSDYTLYRSILQILNSKRGQRDPTISRTEIIQKSGLTPTQVSRKVLNSYLTKEN